MFFVFVFVYILNSSFVIFKLPNLRILACFCSYFFTKLEIAPFCYIHMLCYVMLCYVILFYAMQCCSLLYFLYYVMLCYVVLCLAIICYCILCYVMLCCVILCSVCCNMLCYVMFYYALLFSLLLATLSYVRAFKCLSPIEIHVFSLIMILVYSLFVNFTLG